MARNHRFFFDPDGIPRARGPSNERLLMTFLETDVQGSDHICHDLMDDLTAVEDGTDESREFVGNAHSVTLSVDGVVLQRLDTDAGDVTGAPPSVAPTIDGQATEPTRYEAPLKHFREILEDWEAFILDDQLDDPMLDDDLPV